MPLPALVDSHCHLDFPDFAGETDAVVARAAAAGVTRMVTICTRLRLAPQVRALAEAHDGVFWAAGTHPMHAAEEPMARLDELTALARHPKFVGIGETGLDYHYTADSKPRSDREPPPPRRGRPRHRPSPHHPRPRRRRGRGPHPRRGARRRRLRLRHALLHRRPRAGRDRPLPRLLPVDLRHRDLPQRGRAARDLRRRAPRPPPRRDRQPLPRAGSPPRQAQRARLSPPTPPAPWPTTSASTRRSSRHSPPRTSTALFAKAAA